MSLLSLSFLSRSTHLTLKALCKQNHIIKSSEIKRLLDRTSDSASTPKEQGSSPFLDDGGVQRLPSSPTWLGRTSTSLLSHPQTRNQSSMERGQQAPLHTQSPGCEMPALHPASPHSA